MIKDITYKDFDELERKIEPDRRLPIFFIYLIFGPPIGGVIFAIGWFGALFISQISSTTIVPAEALWTHAQAFPLFLLLSIVFSYLFGGVQAILTGLFISAFAKRNGKFGYRMALLASFSGSLLGGLLFARDSLTFLALLTAIGVLASILIRFVFRNRFGGVVAKP
ncbi:MAG: hypothetical protein AAFW68_07190 [Pseudomonadota bacterium]